MKKLAGSPWTWAVLFLVNVFGAITTSITWISFLSVLSAAVCAGKSVAVISKRKHKARQIERAPIQQFRLDLEKCEPAEAEWLRLHHRADFGESFKLPVHPYAQVVIDSLKPAKVKKEKVEVGSVKAMRAEIDSTIDLLHKVMSGSPSRSALRDVDVLIARVEKLQDMIILAEEAKRQLPAAPRAVFASGYYETGTRRSKSVPLPTLRSRSQSTEQAMDTLLFM